MGPQRGGLPGKQELGEANALHLLRQALSRALQRVSPALYQLGRPVEIVAALVLALQRPEQRVVIEPARLARTELLERAPQVRTGPGPETPPGRFQQPLLVRNDRLVVDEQ
jgi:hypothetical protein